MAEDLSDGCDQQAHDSRGCERYRRSPPRCRVSDRRANRELASRRIDCEHVIGKLKVFRILMERYRNRRRRVGLRVNLIAAIYNFELKEQLRLSQEV
jgi:hypothetical protein